MSSNWPSQAVSGSGRIVRVTVWKHAHRCCNAASGHENRRESGRARNFVNSRRAGSVAPAGGVQRASRCHTHSVLNLLNLHETTGPDQANESRDALPRRRLGQPGRVRTASPDSVRHMGVVTYVTARRRQLLNNPPHKSCFDTGGVAAHNQYCGTGEKRPRDGSFVFAPFQCMSVSFSSSGFEV